MTGSADDDLAAETAAWITFEELRGWWDGDDTWRICPHCESRGRFMLLVPRSGQYRRTWKCGACRRQFSAITGTGLAGTKLPMTVWLAITDRWIEIREKEHRQPTVQEVAAVHPSLRGNEAFRAWYRIAHCSDADPLLTTYRDW